MRMCLHKMSAWNSQEVRRLPPGPADKRFLRALKDRIAELEQKLREIDE